MAWRHREAIPDVTAAVAVRSGSATNHFPAFRARAPQQIVCNAAGSGRGTLTVGKGYDDARVCRWQREAVMNARGYHKRRDAILLTTESQAMSAGIFQLRSDT
jgi:hypothetical protein